MFAYKIFLQAVLPNIEYNKQVKCDYNFLTVQTKSN